MAQKTHTKKGIPRAPQNHVWNYSFGFRFALQTVLRISSFCTTLPIKKSIGAWAEAGSLPRQRIFAPNFNPVDRHVRRRVVRQPDPAVAGVRPVTTTDAPIRIRSPVLRLRISIRIPSLVELTKGELDSFTGFGSKNLIWSRVVRRLVFEAVDR